MGFPFLDWVATRSVGHPAPSVGLSAPNSCRLLDSRCNKIGGERIIIIIDVVADIESARIAAFIRFPPPMLYFFLPEKEAHLPRSPPLLRTIFAGALIKWFSRESTTRKEEERKTGARRLPSIAGGGKEWDGGGGKEGRSINNVRVDHEGGRGFWYVAWV